MIIEKRPTIFNIPQSSPWPVLLRCIIFNMFCGRLIWIEANLTIRVVISQLLIFFLLLALWVGDISWEALCVGLRSFEIDISLKVSII